MHTPARRVAPAVLIAWLITAGSAGLRADELRYYREGAVPDPAVVARLLGRPAHAARGLDIDLSSAADGGETLSESRIDSAAATAVADWKQGQAAVPPGADAAASPPAAPPASAAEALAAPPPVPPLPADGVPERPAFARAPVLALAIRFANGSARLAPNARAPLDAVAAGLRMGGLSRHVVIEGHANATGPAGINRSLSAARAEAVRRYLIEHGGIPAQLLSTVGYGADHPLANRPAAAPENRRVQFRPSDA